ncbi:pirin family protein [Candidatus Bipolaricaulota bacterium]|nr:pirin family protein [Candidatus Bipolaricaulota bacterium]
MIRGVRDVLAGRPTIEGAGVHLRRVFGSAHVPRFDPFLLLDDFRSSHPDDFVAGFPWHPHRGIETITYMLEGSVEHADSLKNVGIIGPSDVQWMTAGAGIIHQEMPMADASGRMGGFQLWANLPAAQKMMPPRYREVQSANIPEVEHKSGARIRIICGQVDGVRGPIADIVTEPEYLDIAIPAGAAFEHAIPRAFTALAYVFQGSARFGLDAEDLVTSEHLVAFDEGDTVQIRAGDDGARLLLLSGRPIGEPIAWGGPIVMNTEDELLTAFSQYREGTFLTRAG